jgi:hypothetical protein
MASPKITVRYRRTLRRLTVNAFPDKFDTTDRCLLPRGAARSVSRLIDFSYCFLVYRLWSLMQQNQKLETGN